MASKEITDTVKELQDAWPLLQNEFFQRSPGKYLALTATYRSPEEQFSLFKKGRTQLPSGEWAITDKNQVVTNIDGYKIIGAHNYNPSRAIDVVVVDNQTGKALWSETYYYPLVEIAGRLGLESGGTWHSIKDWPHIQVPNYQEYRG